MQFNVCIFIIGSIKLLKGPLDIQQNGIMENKSHIKEKFEHIIQIEGNSFEFNEIEIEKDYGNVHQETSSIAIIILSVIGSFLGTLAFPGFLLAVCSYHSDKGLVVMGGCFVGAAIWLNKAFNKLIIVTFSITLYAIGICALTLGLIIVETENTTCFTLIVIAILTISISRNDIQFFISVLLINNSILYLIANNQLYSLIHVYNVALLILLTLLFLNEEKLFTGKLFPVKLYSPIRIGLIISLIVGFYVGQIGIFDYDKKRIWASSIITIPLTIYIVSKILKIKGVTNNISLYPIFTLTILFLFPTA